jgi:hypothetical protein
MGRAGDRAISNVTINREAQERCKENRGSRKAGSFPGLAGQLSRGLDLQTKRGHRGGRALACGQRAGRRPEVYVQFRGDDPCLPKVLPARPAAGGARREGFATPREGGHRTAGGLGLWVLSHQAARAQGQGLGLGLGRRHRAAHPAHRGVRSAECGVGAGSGWLGQGHLAPAGGVLVPGPRSPPPRARRRPGPRGACRGPERGRQAARDRGRCPLQATPAAGHLPPGHMLATH